MTICILGRQSKLSLAELEAVFGAEKVKPLGEIAAIVETAISAEQHNRLGGVVKVAKILNIIPSTDWSELAKYCQENLPENLEHLPEGKLKLGLSSYNLHVSPKRVSATGLTLKKIARSTGRSVRVIPNTTPDLGSAQVIHNQLTSPLGMELLFIGDGKQTYLAQTTSVQDIEAYGKRDFERPGRDTYVGMLPPKLAQIMINLAAGPATSTKRILDPFCGTGVVLMEAALMGHAIYGTDLNERIIRLTRDNLNWLEQRVHKSFDFYLEVGDATTHIWQQPIDIVAGETFLGQPLISLPSHQKMQEIVDGCNKLISEFLENLHSQITIGTPICIAVPSWRYGQNFIHLPLIDQLDKIGYNQVSFSHATREDLLYYRADQIVARELLVLTRK